MNPEIVLVELLPFVLYFAVSLELTVLAFTRRRVQGARELGLLFGTFVILSISLIFELLSTSLETKYFWDTIQYIFQLLLPIVYLKFLLSYHNQTVHQRWREFLIAATPPLFLIAVIVTNGFQGGMRASADLVEHLPFSTLTYDFYWVDYLAVMFTYASFIIQTGFLVWHSLKQEPVARRRAWYFVLWVLFPLIGTILTLMGFEWGGQRDLSPLTFTFTNAFLAWGLLRNEFFDVLPLARGALMDNFTDAVLVMDGVDNVLDANFQACALLQQDAQKIKGQLLTAVLPGIKSKEIRREEKANFELTIESGGEKRFYDVSSVPLLRSSAVYAGRMLILHDSTRRKMTEVQLRSDQDVLEQRVGERTADLAAANASLKAEVEQRRRAELEKETQRSEMEILYRLMAELSALPVDADLESMVTKRLKELTGAFFVTVSDYNPEKKLLELRRLEADKRAIREANNLLGKNVVELVFPVDQALYTEMVNEITGYYDNLSEATSGAVPSMVGVVLEKLFNLGTFIGMAIQHQGELMGAMMLVMQHGHTVPSDWLVKALANVMSIIYRRKRAEMEQRESEKRFYMLAEMLPQSIYECTLTGELTYVNRKALEEFGYSELEPGLLVTDMIVPSQRDIVRQQIGRQIQGELMPPREYLAQRKDGSTFPALVYSAPINQNNRPIGFRGAVVDITELKLATEALRFSEEKFRSIIEQSSEGVILIDEEGLVLELNHAFEKIYGIPRNELVGTPFWEMTRRLNYQNVSGPNPLEDAQMNFNDVIQTGNGAATLFSETEFVTPDGQRRIIQRTSFPVMVSQGWRMAAVVTDITERKIAELEQRRLNRTLTMISECNKALIRMDDEADLLQTICKIMVELGEYRFTTIGYVRETDPSRIQPVLAYGQGGDYLKELAENDAVKEVQALRRFIMEQVKSSRPVIINDTRTDPFFAPLRDVFLKQGFLSVIIFPLSFGAEFFGSLNLYGAEVYAPDQNELGLLTEMVNDVSFGIHVRRMRIDRDRAEQKVRNAIGELHQAYESTLEGWSRALELRERETAGHSQRVVALTLAVAQKLGVPDDQLVHIQRGALLHDIGKMGVPDHILLKPDSLNEEEWAVMRQHPQFAHQLLSNIPYLAPALDIPYCHHEYWDGSGYPRGLKGDEIPLAARIFAAVDVWDALTYDRPYRSAWSEANTRTYIRSLAGTQLDPQVVDAFLNLVDQSHDIQQGKDA